VTANGTGIVAFDKRTGEVRYQGVDELASYASPTAATIGGRPWCFVLARGGLIGFDPRDGKVDFHFPFRSPLLESVNASSPVVVDDLVLISECYSLGACLLRVRPGASSVVWRDGKQREKAMEAHWNTPIHHEGFVYGSSGRHTPEAELKCIELATGKSRWSQPDLTRCSLLYVDRHFVCLGEDGVLRLLRASPQKYDEVAVWDITDSAGRRLLEYPAWAAPVLAHGLLYVRGKDELVCLELLPPQAAR
jgi:hypothetical protein